MPACLWIVILLACVVLRIAGTAAQPYPPPGTPQPGARPLINPFTPEYCWRLSAEVSEAQRAMAGLPADVAMLAFEGRKMCERGHFRPGVLRLRHALMLLRGR